MELKTKKILITDSKGKEINIKRRNVIIYLNAKKTDISLGSLFSYAEFDDGEIYGNSLLSFYKVQEDGSLYVEGSIVQLFDTEANEFILIKKISRPVINDDTTISFEEVQNFSHDLSISKPHEVFPYLTEEEKNVFIAEYEQREATTRQQQADAAKALADAEKERLEKEKITEEIAADKERRAKVKPDNLYTEKLMRALRTMMKDKKCNENIKDKFHVFYGAGSEEEPLLMIKQGKDWWERPEEQEFLVGETDKELLIEFSDLGTQREAIFNTETGEIKLKE